MSLATDNPQRILIVKPSAIGDVVHTLPILNLLRKKFPAAHIAWLVTPACKGILDGHPQLDQIILFERKKWLRSVGLMKTLRHGKFDWVLDLQGLFRSGLFSFATGASVRVGFKNAREGAPLFYTDDVKVPDVNVHAIERYLDLAAAIGCDRGPVEYVFATDQADRQHVQNLLAIEREGPLTVQALEGGCPQPPIGLTAKKADEDLRPPDDGARSSPGKIMGTVPIISRSPVAAQSPGQVAAPVTAQQPYAVLLPGTNWATKRWPADNFAAMVEPLQQRFGLTSVLAGLPAETAEVARLAPAAINLAGKTTLRQLVALIEKASLVIANDSGPMHIAVALKRPLVTLFGPTNPVRTGPYGRADSVVRLDIPCSPCYSRSCSHCSCLRWLEIEPVLEEAGRQLRR